MHADLLAQKLLHLITCPWKTPAQRLHVFISFSFKNFQYLMLHGLHSYSYRLNLSSLFFALLYLMVTAYWIT